MYSRALYAIPTLIPHVTLLGFQNLLLETRDQPIMLIFSLLCYAAVLKKLPIMLKNKNYVYFIITIYIQICMNKLLLIAHNLERLFY